METNTDKGKFDKKIVDTARMDWNKTRGEMELIMDFPPFVDVENSGTKEKPRWGFDLTTNTGRKFIDEFKKELKRIDSLIPEKGQNSSLIDPDVFGNPFDILEKKFPDELGEARLWQKRFPGDPIGACRKLTLG